MTPEEFLFHCTGALSSADWEELERIVERRVDECTSRFAEKWFGADAQLRNAAARVRATRRSMDAGEYLRAHPGWDSRVEKAVTDAFAKTTPREREATLDDCRWQILDELALEEPDGFAVVGAYAVKLGITARWHDMKDEAGQARVEEIIESNTNEEAWNNLMAPAG
jgi:hypothetical protein